MSNLLGSGKPFNLPSVINDPFKEDKVEKITFSWYKWNNHWTGEIGFNNGNTNGSQKLTPGQDLDEMVRQIKVILETLKNK